MEKHRSMKVKPGRWKEPKYEIEVLVRLKIPVLMEGRNTVERMEEIKNKRLGLKEKLEEAPNSIYELMRTYGFHPSVMFPVDLCDIMPDVHELYKNDYKNKDEGRRK